jgi:cell shape-determining protein MreC
MEEFVHFENFFQNHRAYKKNLRAIEQEKAETQSVEAQNTGALRALRVSETAIILFYQF